MPSTLDAVVYRRISEEGGITVPRGKSFESALARRLDIAGVNRRLIYASVRRLVAAGQLVETFSKEQVGGGSRGVLRSVHYGVVPVDASRAPADAPRGLAVVS